MIRTSQTPFRPGVTLIETIMVIVLLSAAAVTSSMLLDGQWVARRSVTSVTNEVAATLRAARNTAITNQTIVQVRRQRSRGIEQLLISEDAGPFGAGGTRTIELGSDIRLRGRPRTIEFRPTGSANRPLSWTVSRSRSRGTINVLPADGQVTQALP